MVSRPHWRLSATQWRARLDQWRSHYDPQAAMDLSITLDARPVAGNAALFAPLEAQMLALGGDERLLHSMASAVLQFESPLSFFGQLRQDERGLDIKRGGIFPVVHGLRCLALKHGIAQRSSFARCEALGFRQMIAVIGDSANEPSIRLHARCGFARAGLLPSIGWKHGRWVDSVLMIRPLGAGDSTPPDRP